MIFKDAQFPTDTIRAGVKEELLSDLIEIDVYADHAETIYLTKEDAIKFGQHLIDLSNE